MRSRQKLTPRTGWGPTTRMARRVRAATTAAWLLSLCLAPNLRAGDLRFTGTLEYTDISIRWTGGTYCRHISKDSDQQSTSTSISIPLEVHADPAQWCLASPNLAFIGTFSVSLPTRTPPGTLDMLRSLRFDTPMLSTVALDGTLVLDKPMADNTFELRADVSHSAPGPTCRTDDSMQGPGMPAGSYPVALSSTCQRGSMSFPVEDGTALIYEIRHYGHISLMEPAFPYGDRTLVVGSFEATSYYRVSTVQGIGLDPSAIEFDLGRSMTDPAPKTVRLENLGNGDLQFNVTTDRPWLSVTPESGTLGTRESVLLEARVAAASLVEEEEKTIAGNIVVSGNSPDSPQIVPVAVHAPVAELIGLEVTQGVQDWNNSVPLIAQRPAIVRAHLRSLRKGPVKVRARLRGTRDGADLPGSPLAAENPGGTLDAQPQAAQLRGDLAQSLWFVLWSWDWRQGQVGFSLESEPGEKIACAESAGIPHDCEVDVTFGPATSLPIRWVLIDWEEANGTKHTNAKHVEKLLWERLYSSLPVAQGDRWTTRIQWGGSVPPKEEDVLPELDKMQLLALFLRDPEPNRIYYGAIAGEEISGLAQGIPSSVAAGYLPAGDDAEGRLTHVHEIGHCLGRHHAPFCGAVVGPDAPAFPYVFEIGGQQRPTLGPMESGPDSLVYGLELRHGRVVDPSQFFELMSYCGKPPIHFWPSKFTYEGILATLRARGATVPSSHLDAGPKTTVQVVRGQIDHQTDTARWLPFMTLSDVISPAPPVSGTYLLQFLDAQGAVRREVPFAPSRYQGMGGESHAGAFMVAVERDPAVRQVRLLHDNALLAARSASPNPPQVRVLLPDGGENLAAEEVTFTWTAQDADGDPLVFDLQYSRDDGATWLTLVTGWPGQQYAITREMAPATNQGRVRVFAHDGFHTAEDTSGGTFSSANHPPQVAISAPTPFELVTESQQVSFSAEAWDVEDGFGLDAIEWSSSLDGALGEGTAFGREASALTEGTHIITARIADAAGAVGAAEVELVVGRATPAGLADIALAMWAQPSAVASGETFLLTARVTNHGPAPATAVALTLPVPDGVAPGAAATTRGNCTLAGDTMLCELGALDPAEQAVVTWSLTPGAPGTVLVEGSVAAAEVDPRPADNGAWVEVEVRSAASGNLLRNPGAEEGAGSRTGNDLLPIPGWVTAANFTAGLYGGRDLLTAAESERVDGGANFFYGGPTTAFSSARQVVDVSGEASAIDAGQRRAVLGARLGTLGSGGDDAQLRAEFLNEQGTVLGQVRLGPVQATDGELRAESAEAPVPPGTRQIRVSLESTRRLGSSNDGCFDNISLTLEPEEPAVALTIARSGASVALLWPATLAGVRLEQSDTARPEAAWSPVAAVPEVVGDQYRVVVPANTGAQFFRLSR